MSVTHVSQPPQQVTMSLWILLGIGFSVGTLAGLTGIGGGFMMVPALVYLVGIPSFMAVGTDLFQIIFSASYGTVRHTMSGNVMIFAAFIMLLASTIGVKYGVMVTWFVWGVSARYILGMVIILAAVAATLKLAGILLDDTIGFEIASIAVTFGNLVVTVIMLLGLFVLALRYRKGKHIPKWMESFVATENG